MHDLDRSDLVFESDPEEGLEAFDDDDGGEDEYDDDGVFDDVEESELASELLSIGDDRELDYFIGALIKKASRKLRPLSKSLRGNLGSLIKGAVKKVLPTVAGIAGGAIGGPAGAMIASRAPGVLGNVLGLELEGLSPEDQEFEAAKQLVRMAGSAIADAANRTAEPAVAAARDAVIAAARKHVPGLVRGAAGSLRGNGVAGAQSGTWYRRGNRIVIVGV